jgi:hypothetical protein
VTLATVYALTLTNEHFLPSCPPDNHLEMAEDVTEEESAFESDDSEADRFNNEEYNWHDNSDEECDAPAQAFDLDDRAQLEAAYDRFGFGLLYELSADELLHILHYQVKITKNVSYEVHQLYMDICSCFIKNGCSPDVRTVEQLLARITGIQHEQYDM